MKLFGIYRILYPIASCFVWVVPGDSVVMVVVTTMAVGMWQWRWLPWWVVDDAPHAENWYVRCFGHEKGDAVGLRSTAGPVELDCNCPGVCVAVVTDTRCVSGLQ